MNKKFILGILLCTLIPSLGQQKENIMTQFTLSSPAFSEGEFIPSKFTCEGSDLSPELVWSSIPEETKSFALTCVDPDAPMGDWIHWVAWDIPADSSSLKEGISPSDQESLKQGINSWGRTGNGGPCPPPGHGPHRYYFTLYALDVAHIDLQSSARLEDLRNTIDNHILAKASLMGKYERK